jgi:hypothetical protein
VAVGANAAALTWSSDVPAGFTGQSLDLSANNVAVQINNTATTDANYQTTFDEGIATKFTTAFWFKGSLAGTWVSKSGNTPWGWKTRPLSPKADFTMRSNTGESVASSMTSANDVNDGNWHHIAAVFDGTASFRQIYVDGVLQKQVTGNPYAVKFNNLSHLVLGATQGNAANDTISTFFPGLLYDVRMYSYPLTATEVADLAGLSTSNYSTWATDNGIGGEPASGDFDMDGLTNLMEYALGKDPKVSSQPAGELVANVITFTKGADAIANGDVSWVIEESDDLGLVDPWAPVVTQAPGSSDATISYTLPAGHGKVFARLVVTQQP